MPTVLLVEDDEMIIKMYTRALELASYKVVSAENGLTALELVTATKPDIILLDIMMPTMNGVQFMKRYGGGAEKGGIPIIVLTNVSDEHVKAEAVSVGASIVLVKSDNDPDEVVDTVNKVLNKEILQVGSLESDEGNGPAGENLG